jgi:hypothetical protein
MAHIDAIITTGVKGYKNSIPEQQVPAVLEGGIVSWEAIKPEDATKAGQTLVNANYRSVNARYGESRRPPRYTYTGRGRILTLGELAQAIGSLDYQSCEYDEWYTSSARKLLDRLELRIFHWMPRNLIPGYTGEVHVIG